MYSFTNRFNGSDLRQRIGMMNNQRSGSSAWWRYVAWLAVMSVMAFACRHRQSVNNYAETKLPVTNATRRLIADLEKYWFLQSSLSATDETILINGRRVAIGLAQNYPEVLCLRRNHLALKSPDDQQAKVYINGQEKPVQVLLALTFEELNELMVYQKWEDIPGARTHPESYRIYISTLHKTPAQTPIRLRWKQFLQANALSDYPLGKSSSFSMNELLEATFFSNELAFVTRTKDNYLKLYDEYSHDIDVYINGLAVEPERIEGVHIREVDKLYTRERLFNEWADSLHRAHRFALYIQTAPARAKRDSSYYVFSPFYSGDF